MIKRVFAPYHDAVNLEYEAVQTLVKQIHRAAEFIHQALFDFPPREDVDAVRTLARLARHARPINYTEAQIEGNKVRCAALVHDALRGDLRARAEYEKHRLITPSAMSEYSWGQIVTVARAKLVPVFSGRLARTNITFTKDGFSGNAQDLEQQHLKELGFEQILTYHSAKEVLAITRKENRSGPLEVTDARADEKQKIEIAVTNKFSLLDGSKWGEVAQGIHELTHELALRYVVAEDFLLSLELPPTKELLRALLKRSREPWGLAHSVTAKRLIAAAPAIRNLVDVPKEDLERLALKVISSPDPVQTVDDYANSLSGFTASELESLFPDESKEKEEGLSVPPRGIDDIAPEWRRFAPPIKEALNSQGFRNGIAAKYEKRLSKLVNSGAIDLAHVLTAITKSSSEAELQAISKKYFESGKKKGELLDSNVEALDEEDEEEKTVPKPQVKTHAVTLLFSNIPGDNWFSEWKESLDKKFRSKVERRTKAIEEAGSFGDYRQLSSIGSGGLYELRFIMPGAVRIYFGRLSEDTYIIVGAGNKETQWWDIDEALSVLKEEKRIFRKKQNLPK